MTLTTAAAYDWVRSVVSADAAIVVDAGKDYLIESRLLPLARAAGAADVTSYIDRMRATPTRQIRQALVEALTTNETSWFRDVAPFTMFETSILAQLKIARSSERRLRIWSAACSSGQEPYGLAMILRESLVREGWKAEIVATDIDETILAKARSGTYSQLEMNRGLPVARLTQHFGRHGAGWQINPEVQSLVSFSRINLAEGRAPFGLFDVVFLRNVLIYFTVETRREILKRVRRVIRPDGYLILGSSETLLGADAPWERVVTGSSTYYRPSA
jgi:chemotaxis protein methyltransferase CheR